MGGHVASIEERRGVYRTLMGKSKRKKNNLEGLGVNGMIILKCLFGKWDEGSGLDSSGSG
jgi:hypothetical protein